MNVHYSASQIKTFSRCARQWHLDKWSSFPTPPAGAGAALGGLVHAEIESFLYAKTGSLHEVAEPGREFLEWLRAKPALLIEHTINRDGIVGVIDAYTDGLVIDHKTSSDPEKWGLTPDQLANDLQMTIYAAWAFNKEPERQSITIAHAYYGTKRRSFKLVKATVSRERIERQYQEALWFINDHMAHLATSDIDSFDIPGEPSACSAFGGCGFLKICNPKKGAQKMPTLQELLAKRQPAVEVIAPEAPSRETPPEATEAAPPLEAAIDIQKAVDAICKAHPSTTQAALSIAKTATNARRWTKNRTTELIAAAGGRFTFDDLGSVIYKDTPAAVPFRTPRPTTAIPSAPTGGGLTLYINAIPIKGATGTTFADLIAAAVKAYPTDPQLVDYGKGIADIIAAVEPPAFGVVFVDTANPYWGRASQKWISCAAVVVRGV